MSDPMAGLPLESDLSTYKSRVAATTVRTSVAVLFAGYVSFVAEMTAVFVNTVPTATPLEMEAVR